MKILRVFLVLLAGVMSICAAAQAGNRNNLLGGFGQLLGMDKKTVNIIGKGLNLVKSLRPIQYREEKAIGGGVALQAFSRFGGPYPDEGLNRYVSMVGKGVALASDRPDIPYYFSVLNSEEANAFAAPGGYIFVTVGLLKNLETEAQLAGVLGHEIAHVAKRHSLQTIERGKRLHGISELSLTLMDKDPRLFSDIINNVSELIFTKGLDHSLEYEADRFGIRYAARLGYNPRGLEIFLKKLARERHGGLRSVFFQTHPSTESRIAKLAREVRVHYPRLKGYRTVARRFQERVASAWNRK